MRKLPESVVAEALRLYTEEKMPSQKVAARLGIAPGSVINIITRAGHSMRDRVSARWRVHDLDAVVAAYRSGESLAEIASARGLSFTSIRNALLRAGEPLKPTGDYPGANAARWKGGRVQHRAGYILVFRPDHPDASSNGYVLEHRLVMEQKIGQRIPASMDVHHINGVKSDNAPENLELLSKSDHARRHAAQRRSA